MDLVFVFDDLVRSFERLLGVGSDEMGAEGGAAGADRPEVEVVHLLHAGNFFQVGADRDGVEVGGSSFHQDHDGLADDFPRTPDDPEREEERDEGVDRVPSGEPKNETAEDDADAAEEIADDVQVGGADIQAMGLVCVERAHHEQIRCETDRGDDKDDGALDGLRMGEATEGFVDQHAA